MACSFNILLFRCTFSGLIDTGQTVGVPLPREEHLFPLCSPELPITVSVELRLRGLFPIHFGMPIGVVLVLYVWLPLLVESLHPLSLYSLSDPSSAVFLEP